MSNRAIQILGLAIMVLVTILFAIHFAGSSWIQASRDIYKSNFGSVDNFSEMLTRFTPLLIAGVAVHIALRAGLFNIGADGQFVIGALACAIVGTRIGGVVGLLLAVVCGFVAGGVWATPAGIIKAYRGGHEVITTIMLNSIAGFVALALVTGPFKAPHQETPTTSNILMRLWNLHAFGITIPSALLITLPLPFVFEWIRTRTVAGYEVEATGASPMAAKFAGISTEKIVVQAMMASGALAGLAGALEVVAFQGRFFPDISSGTGFNALGVALLAGASPIGVVPAALAFGMLSQASPLLQIDGMPKGLVQLILGLLIAIGAAIRFRKTRSAIELR